MTGHAFQVFLEDDELRPALAAILSALSENGRFVFEARNPLIREWETWTPDNAMEIISDGEPIRMSHLGESEVRGDLVSITLVYTIPAWEQSQTSRRTLRFLDPSELSSFLCVAGLIIDEQYGDWDRQPLTKTSPEIITVARRS